jgi:hypothetical protein
MWGILNLLKYSMPSNEKQATSSRATLCKSQKRHVGAQPNIIPKLLDSDEPRTPLVVTKALTGSQPFQKESPRTLRCPPDSESTLRHLILTDGLLNPARQDPNHQSVGAKTPQSHQNQCRQFKRHLCDSATLQKARLPRLNLSRTLPNLAHAYQTAWLHGQLTTTFFRKSGRLPCPTWCLYEHCCELSYHWKHNKDG